MVEIIIMKIDKSALKIFISTFDFNNILQKKKKSTTL